MFYRIGPTVAVLIAESCYRPSRRYIPDWRMTVLALACLIITVLARAELAVLFIAGLIIGVLLYGRPGKKEGKKILLSSAVVTGAILASSIDWGRTAKLAFFFFEAGAFTFGSGLAVAPFLHQGAVLDHQ